MTFFANAVVPKPAPLGVTSAYTTATLLLPTSTPSTMAAATPVLGWNSWNFFRSALNETVVKNTADLLISTGLAAKGYTFVNMDDIWSVRDPTTHELIAIPAKFPSGLAGVASYVHSKNLKFGAYIDVGHLTCGKCPGTWGYEKQDADALAKAGVDFVKSDSCFTDPHNVKLQPANGAACFAKYQVFSHMLKATGRDIIHSIKGPCGHAPGTLNCTSDDPANPTPCCSPGDASSVANFRRAAGDVKDNWASVLKVLDSAAEVVQYTRPGFFADLDILEIGNGGLTEAEEKSMMTLWCAAKSPLLLGNDLSTMSKRTLAIVGNEALIAVNQDPTGKAALRVVNTEALQVWTGPLSQKQVVVVILNLQDQVAEVAVTFKELGLSTTVPIGTAVGATDLWSGNHTQFFSGSKVHGHAEAHGVAAFTLTLP